MRKHVSLALVIAVLGAGAWTAFAQTPKPQEPTDDSIHREKLSLTGWDPDEPVPALVYYKYGNQKMPVVIFTHGLRGNKELYPERMKDLARKGLFVVSIDAHLHGERKVPGVFESGVGRFGTDYHIWVHQSSVSHTARDISRIIDGLSARSDVDVSRVGVAGISMGSSTCMVAAWRDRRISVVAGLIGAVDFRYDMTRTPPGPDQDAKRKAMSPRVRDLIDSIDPQNHKTAYAPKALFLANGAKDDGIDIESVKKFVKDLGPGYASYPDRLKLLEEPDVGHSLTDRMWTEGTEWLVRHLLEQPIRSPR
jgi:dienelactone hydrolase